MSNIQILLIIAGVVVGVLATLLVLIPYLKKKGINVEDIIKELKNDSTIAKAVADEIKPILPKQMQGVVDIIEKWAPIAVGNAEQLAHTGDIDKADRGKVAEDVVLNVLKDLDITPTENQIYIIDASIKNAVNALGHSTEKVSAYVAGTNDTPGGIAITKEKEPELATLPQGTKVIPSSQLNQKATQNTLKAVPVKEAKPEEIKPLGETNTQENVAPVENTVKVDTPSTQSLSPEDAQKIQDAMQAVHEIANKANIQISKF